jgi:tartrate dehydrogenase/decarboxylase/D-malate dehydrogenase
MMLEHLGEGAAAAAIMQAIESVLSVPDGARTPDLGGRARTTQLGTAIADAVRD